jgi:two-component system sensor histidine kinase/response regulator
VNLTGLGAIQNAKGIVLAPTAPRAAASIAALRKLPGCSWSDVALSAVPPALNADLLVAAPADADAASAVLREFRASWQRDLVPLVVILPETERSLVLESYARGADFVATPADPLDLLCARVRGLLHVRALVRLLVESRNRAKSQLEQHQRWARFLVHDMRNPLTVLSSGLESIHFVSPLAAEDRTFLDELRPEVGRLSALVSDLLDHERLQSGVLVPACRSVDLVPLAADVVARTEALGRARGVTVQVSSQQGEVAADVDPALIERVLENLLSNAIRHSPAGELVDVDLWHQGSTALIAIANAGPLIPPELRESIFEPYVQLEGAHGRAGASGLGLAFCREVVSAHSGTIQAGERDGRTCFTVELPR